MTVRFMTPPANEDASLTDGTVTYDICFQASAPVAGEQIQLIVNLEAPNDFYPGYPLIKRGIYYCSRMISAQYGAVFTAADFKAIRKVYSIWICTHPPKNRENTITRYEITEKNLVGNVRETVADYDLMAAVMVCLGKPGSEKENGALKLLDVLLSTETEVREKQRILQEDFAIQMTQTLERKVSVMCNLSKGVWEKGATDFALNAIRNLMETMGWSVEQAMAALKIPEADRAKYAGLLKESPYTN